jgi:hypothetical protein
MLVGQKYKIESDSLNVTLYEKTKGKKPDSTTWRAIGFFSSPQNALQHLVTLGVMKTGLKDLKTVIEKLEELYGLINSLEYLPERVESRRGFIKRET